MHGTRAVGMALALIGLAVGAVEGQGRKVSGTVVDAVSDQAVAGARVEYDEDDVVQATRTDERGHFGFGQGGLGAVPDHEVTLQAVLDDGRRSDTVTVTVGPGMMWTSLVLVAP